MGKESRPLNGMTIDKDSINLPFCTIPLDGYSTASDEVQLLLIL
jgi:hypothetical protein